MKFNALLIGSVGLTSLGLAQTPQPSSPVPTAPPPGISETRDAPRGPATADPPVSAFTTEYDHGDATDLEQYYLELLNRARANPPVEGGLLATTTDPDVQSAYTFFGVNLSLMQTEFNAISPAPPLAFNAKLAAAARLHSADMLANIFQGHNSSGSGATPGDRITAQGYNWQTYGENVYAAAKSVWHGHAGFEVDWGYGADGMQSPRGHRNSIHNAAFREVGVGVLLGNATDNSVMPPFSVGPQLVTQDFSTAQSSSAFVLGVAYYDLNSNGFYDPGEGIGDLTVTVDGASYHAVTAPSGGYAIPVPTTNATRLTSFVGLNLSGSSNAVISGGNNVKVDFIPTYTDPTPTGDTTPGIGIPTPYSFPMVGGATGYLWRWSERLAQPDDGAENLSLVTDGTAVDYNVLSTTVKYAGSSAYHFAHPNFEANQTVTYQATLIPGAGATVQFRSRLRTATTYQHARVQVSTNQGGSWIDVYDQAGDGTSGESSFILRSVNLSAYVGQEILLRFNYVFLGTSAYTQTSDSVGWFVDAIDFTDVDTLTTPTETAVSSGTSFTFTPAAASTYLLSVSPTVSGRQLRWSPSLEVQGVTPPPFASWASTEETNAALPSGTLSGNPTADYNHDGVANLTAYALGLSPVNPAAHLLPAPIVAGGSAYFEYQVDTTHTDITVTPRISADLSIWKAPGESGAPAGFSDTLISTSGTVQTRRATVPMGAAIRYFFHLQITQLP